MMNNRRIDYHIFLMLIEDVCGDSSSKDDVKSLLAKAVFLSGRAVG